MNFLINLSLSTQITNSNKTRTDYEQPSIQCYLMPSPFTNSHLMIIPMRINQILRKGYRYSAPMLWTAFVHGQGGSSSIDATSETWWKQSGSHQGQASLGGERDGVLSFAAVVTVSILTEVGGFFGEMGNHDGVHRIGIKLATPCGAYDATYT